MNCSGPLALQVTHYQPCLVSLTEYELQWTSRSAGYALQPCLVSFSVSCPAMQTLKISLRFSNVFLFDLFTHVLLGSGYRACCVWISQGYICLYIHGFEATTNLLCHKTPC
jgi:hypothetical protein